MRSKKILLMLISALLCGTTFGQLLTIEKCHEMAQQNYPLVRQYDLIVKSGEYSLENAKKGYLPQFSLSARATYQSDVTSVPISLPGVKIPALNKDQYQAIVEVSQTIWDGGVISSQKENINAATQADKKQYEVDMYALRQRVNDIYFGILLLDSKIEQNTSYQSILRTSLTKIRAYIENGVANKSDSYPVEAELLSSMQIETELKSSRGMYLQMLETLTGGKIDAGAQLTLPHAPQMRPVENNRPELGLIDARLIQFDVQKKLIAAKNTPKVGAFVQGGYGNPGLNMFKEGFTPYAIAGVRFSWNFGGQYTRKNDLRLIDLNKQKLNTQRDVFLFNTALQDNTLSRQAQKYAQVMRQDEELISLREKIREGAEAKVENGVMTTNDLVRELIMERDVRLTKSTHEIELLKTLFDIQYNSNN